MVRYCTTCGRETTISEETALCLDCALDQALFTLARTRFLATLDR